MPDDPKDVRKRTRARKATFDAAHRRGLDALKRRDMKGFSEALKTERTVVEEQAREIDANKVPAKRR